MLPMKQLSGHKTEEPPAHLHLKTPSFCLGSCTANLAEKLQIPILFGLLEYRGAMIVSSRICD